MTRRCGIRPVFMGVAVGGVALFLFFFVGTSSQALALFPSTDKTSSNVVHLAQSGKSLAKRKPPVFEREEITILRPLPKPAVKLSVQVAKTRAQKAYGLMFREEIPVGQGMIFLFKPPEKAVFWMRNTRMPLDIVFIGEDGAIRKIVEKARPMDETPIPAGEPVGAVLEIGGGQAASLGIAPGDRVVLW